MAMNTPNNQPPIEPQQAAMAPAPQPEAAPVQPEVAAQQEVAPEVAAQPGAAPEQEQQVIEEVAQGLADDEITAEDIMIAVLSDSLGVSPQGAQQLFRLLITDLAQDAQEAEAAPAEQVPPTEGM